MSTESEDPADVTSEKEELGAVTAKAFDFAQDVTKQVLTLAAAIITVTITFFKNFGDHAIYAAKVIMGCSWLAYLLSVILGLWTLMALTGTLQPLRQPDAKPTIQGPNVRLPASLQLISFLIALILSVCAGIITL
jgi:hypothetical protein